jgi:hypothetical protein
MTTKRWPLEQYKAIPARTARLIYEDLHRMHDIYDRFEDTPQSELTVEMLSDMIQEMHDSYIDPMITRVNNTQHKLERYLIEVGKQKQQEYRESLDRIFQELILRAGTTQNEEEKDIHQYMKRVREVIGKKRRGLSREAQKYLRGWDE